MSRSTFTSLRVTRNPRRLVRLELLFLASLSLTVWAIRELRGIL